MRAFRSLDEARAAFDAYARAEPRLVSLWELCERAAPPLRREPADQIDDAFDTDPFEDDEPAEVAALDGWCAEDFFYDHVKSPLLVLVGLHRPAGPEALQTHQAFEEVHDLLLDWALHRPCACCRGLDDEPIPSTAVL